MTAALATGSTAVKRPPDERPRAEGRCREGSAFVRLDALARHAVRPLAARAQPAATRVRLGSGACHDDLEVFRGHGQRAA